MSSHPINRVADAALCLLDGDALHRVRERLRAGDEALGPAAAQLRRDADAALDALPLTITDKPTPPPNGDVHDYMSQGPYWWPDPDTPDGLPYIRRDGEKNPEADTFDRPKLEATRQRVTTLALAHHLFDDPRYAEHAAKLLRVFFIDADTRMNPHLAFGQAIPGKCDGRGIGIIETAALGRDLPDALHLLAGSDAWTDADQAAMQEWVGDYLDWLVNSDLGRDECRESNNHATAYDVQVINFALFVQRRDVAQRVLEHVAGRRIAMQIESDGRQPRELARTCALGYASGNLGWFVALARVGRRLEFDLWDYSSIDGRSIRAALDWLVPYWTGEKPWDHPQITPFDYHNAYALLRQVSFDLDPAYAPLAERVIELPAERRRASRANLLYPRVTRA